MSRMYPRKSDLIIYLVLNTNFLQITNHEKTKFLLRIYFFSKEIAFIFISYFYGFVKSF